MVTTDENLGVEVVEEVEFEPAWAVLFPWFTQWLGIFVFFILTRKLHGLPYTAVMFLLGIFMGVGATRSGPENQLSASIIQWTGIDSEVIFLGESTFLHVYRCIQLVALII